MSKNVESDNPLLNKKIVKSTMKTHAYSTPWDQPCYQEKIVSNQKYSKIESVFDIPYLKDAPDYRTGDFFHRFDICVEKKKNLKKTLDEITKRYNDLMAIFDKELDKTFAGSPTQDQKMRMKDLIIKMMGLYHECREVEHYDDIFKKEVEERKMTFNEEEKEKYDDGMAILKKAFPFQQTIAYQKMNDDFRRIINRFFLEKNMRFYKPKEIQDAMVYKDRLMYKTN
jgi:hypothetical protein